MSKRKVWWWLFVGVVLLLVAGGGMLIGRYSQSTTQTSAKQSSSETKSTVSSSDEAKQMAQSNSVKKDKTNNLKASDLGAGSMVEAIAYYASQHVNQVGSHSWQKLYQSHVDELGTVIISKSNVKKMNKPGMGVAYYVVPRGSDVDISQYPCYTLEKDKSINIYQPGHYEKVAVTVSLKQVVRAVNVGHQADKIRELGENVGISDKSHDIESDGDANHLTTSDMKTPGMTEKVVVFFGISKDSNEFWQSMKRDLARGNTIIEFGDVDNVMGKAIFAHQSENGCVIYHQPSNPTVGRPDLYNFGHYKGDGEYTNNDIPGGTTDMGFTLDEMLKYVNTHGGRQALENIQIKSGSYI